MPDEQRGHAPLMPSPSSEQAPHRASLVKTFGWAFEGLGYAWRTQRNLKIHTAIALAIIFIGLWAGLPWRDWAVIALTIGVVFSAELLNTAVEAIVDIVSPAWHPLAKAAKDTAAAAVLCLALAAVVVGLLLLAPPILARLGILN